MPNFNIVIGAYDKYSVLWQPLVHGIDKYWQYHWKIKFITNFLDAPIGDSIKVGEDKGWGNTIRKGLEQIDADIILWMMDDYWITGPVDENYINVFAWYMQLYNIDHIRLLPPAYPDKGVSPERECKHVSKIDSKLWIFKDDAEFRASATFGLWKKDIFVKYLQGINTPWEFEQKAGINSRGNDRYLCNIDPYILPTSWYCNPYPNGKNSIVSRGKWDNPAYEYAKYEGLNIDFSINPDGSKNETNNIT
jgi:hypothetical protein